MNNLFRVALPGRRVLDPLSRAAVRVASAGVVLLVFWAWMPGAFCATGGPDTYGYTFIDSHEPGGPQYVNIALTASGVSVVSTGDDVSSESPSPIGIGDSVELGHPISLYGSTYTRVIPTSNGYLSFEPGHSGSDFSNDCPLPNPPSHGTGPRLYVFHDDLVLNSTNSQLYYQYFPYSPHPHDEGGVSVFSWRRAQLKSGTYTQLTFQVLIFDNGDILYQYDIPFGESYGASASIGMQNDGGTDGLSYGCNAAGLLTNDTAILFEPPTVTVNTFQDQLDTPSGVNVSLREALRDCPHGGKIVFGPLVNPIDISTSAGGQGTPLELRTSVHIDGGAVSPPVTVQGGDSTRIFSLFGATNAYSIAGLRITDGPGRGLFSSGGNLVIDRCEFDRHSITALEVNGAITASVRRTEFHDNLSTGNGVPILVGNNATLTLMNSALRWNEGGVGAVHLFSIASAEIRDCDISFNCGTDGGGLYAQDMDLLIENTSLTHNRADGDGGAIYFRSGTLTLRNATISGNNARDEGGGLCLKALAGLSGADIRNCTFYGNRAAVGAPIAAVNSTTSAISHTIFCNNRLLSGADGPVYKQANPVTSLGYNLTDVTDPIFSSAGDVQNTDPKISPMTMLPNDTFGHLPLFASPAIDAGGETNVTYDQRGYPRPANGDNAGAPQMDIGAIEATTYLTVNTDADEFDTPSGINLSLREALRDATEGQRIVIDPALNGLTINISTGAHLDVFDQVQVDASALPQKIRVNRGYILAGGYASMQNVVYSNSLAGASPVNVSGALSLHNCEFADHDVGDDYGGAIQAFNDGPLIINGCAFKNNRSKVGGGAIATENLLVAQDCTFEGNVSDGNPAGGQSYVNLGGALFCNSQSRLWMDSCEFRDNQAPIEGAGLLYSSLSRGFVCNSTFGGNVTGESGGGIKIEPPTGVFVQHPGVLTLENCTLSGNSSGLEAGALIADASQGVEFLHCTIVDNYAAAGTGGIVLESNDVTFSHTILADNIGFPNANLSADAASTVASLGYNLESGVDAGFGGTNDL